MARWVPLVVAAAVGLAAAPAALAAPDVRNVLPPGANGLSNLLELGAFEATGARPAHNDDQLGLYAGLLRAPRPFTEDTLDRLFKGADLGVPPGGAATTEHPRPDVTVIRDSAYGVPHVYGATREAAMFGIGYATAHDRLFFMDIFQIGRAHV